MKKIARWALAFATVMSVSGSAMALLDNTTYKILSSSGRREVHMGAWACQSTEQDWTNPFIAACFKRCNWFFGEYGPVAVAEVYLAERMSFEHGSCDRAAYEFTSSMVELDRSAPISEGFTVNGQLTKLSDLFMVQDVKNGVLVGMYKPHHLSSARTLRAHPQ